MVAELTYIMELLVTPAFLVFIIGWFGIKKKVSLLLCVPVCFTVNVISAIIPYWNWVVNTGLLLSHGSASAMIMHIKLIVSTIVIAIGSLVIVLIKRSCKKELKQ